MKILRLLLLSLVLISCQTEKIVETKIKAESIDQLMQHCFENGLFNGTILVAQGEEVLYRKALGVGNRATSEQLMPETRFYLASVSKQFTTAGIMILKERDLLSYDDQLVKFFPEFPDYGREVTIRQMMNHTSGIPDHYGLGAYKPGLTNSDVFQLLNQQDNLDFPSGERYAYSNGGYVLLAMIIEKVSGQPLHVFMKENIFDPLEMNSTMVYDESKPEVSPRAIGYFPSGDLNDYEILTTGAGGMYSNVDDLHRWHLGLFTEKLLSPATLKEAYSPTTLNNGSKSNYGFGWGVDTLAQSVQHSGGLNGFRTYIKRFLNSQDVYIMLTNHGDAFRLNEISAALDSILSGKPFPLPKVPFSQTIRQLLTETSIESAMIQAQELKAQGDTEVDEYGINSLGLSYLRGDEIEKAVAVLELNTVFFPNSSNAFDSYGEALLKKGDTTGAIENYRQSVQLNPNNQPGIVVLQQLGIARESIFPALDIPEETLESYVGDYELEPDFFLTIIKEGDQMFIHPTGQNKSEIFPASIKRFYSKLVNAQFTFNKDETGAIVSLTLHQGGDFEAPKK